MSVPLQQRPWRDWYCSHRWRKRRKAQLRAHPLCQLCLDRHVAAPATVVDHIEPHRGDWNTFWLGKVQSLCVTCHDHIKGLIEAVGYDPTSIGADGWPLDPRHPANRN